MPAWISAYAFDAIQIRAPLCARFHVLIGHGRERNSGGSVPDFFLFVDACGGFPAGSPGLVVAVFIQVDGEIDPIAGGRNFELAIMADVLPIVAEEKLYH